MTGEEMGKQVDVEKCQWDGTDGHGLCDRPATKHVRWAFDSGYLRNAHFCDAHAADVHARKGDAHDAPISLCDAVCPIIKRME